MMMGHVYLILQPTCPPLFDCLFGLPPYTKYQTGWLEDDNYNPYIDDDGACASEQESDHSTPVELPWLAYDSRLAYNGEDAELDIVAENLRQDHTEEEERGILKKKKRKQFNESNNSKQPHGN